MPEFTVLEALGAGLAVGWLFGMYFGAAFLRTVEKK